MPSTRVVVDVWTVPARRRTSPEQWTALDPAERRRAAALPLPTSERFVLGRALLRAAVASRWGCPPDLVPLRVACPECGGPHGRVAVGPGPGGTPPPQVSLTRAGPLVAVALCDVPVGVDTESWTAVGAAPLADVALSPAELAALPVDARRARRDLARAWVRKEAALKALGQGVTVSPADVGLARPPRGTRGVDAVVPGGVLVSDLRLGGGRAGAVAVVAPDLVVRRFPTVGRRRGGVVVRRHDGAEVLAGPRR